jgi:GNAT superfamily N-acetyltransferase
MKSVMAHTEPDPGDLPFISLAPEHLEVAVGLSSESGWNQTADDWQMVLKQGEGLGIMDRDHHLIATAVCLPYGAEFGWISMVLVQKAWRKKGLATRLLRRCIEILEQKGLVPFLDATPQGEAVYRPLGFVTHFGLTRWQADAPVMSVDAKGTRAMTQDDLPAVYALDRQVFGGVRETIIETLLSRAPHMCRWMSDGSGFVLARNGRNASQIGPLVATTDASALSLLSEAVRSAEGPVFIDAVDSKSGVSKALIESGFTVQRSFKRMAKGRKEMPGEPDRLYAIAGPELG